MGKPGMPRVFWGDVHSHCGISYGFGALENALQRAAEQLDFCAVTGHAMWPDIPARDEDTAFLVDFHQEGFARLKALWPQIVKTVSRHNREGEFVTFHGYEMHGSRLGDYHLLSPEESIPLVYAKTPRQLLEKLAGYQGIMIPHHIAYPPGYRGISWDDFDESISPVVEVCSKHGAAMHDRGPLPYYHNMGPRDPRNTVWEGLRRGRRFGFAGSTDHHAGYPGSYGDGKLAVLAEDKTRGAIFDAIVSRRTYAVTGDKILCDLRVNGAPMGSIEPNEAKRALSLKVRACGLLDKVILYKNLKPLRIINGETLGSVNPKGCYKLRIEMGWGNTQDLYDWQGWLQVENGGLCGVETCFRGRSILAPDKGLTAGDDVNRLNNRILEQSGSGFGWVCQTARNLSTLHPATCAVIAEVEGGLDTRIRGQVNALSFDKTIAELLEAGFAAPERHSNSQSVKVHTAVPESQYALEVSMDDAMDTNRDFYHAEVVQANGSAAFVTPVYFGL